MLHRVRAVLSNSPSGRDSTKAAAGGGGCQRREKGVLVRCTIVYKSEGLHHRRMRCIEETGTRVVNPLPVVCTASNRGITGTVIFHNPINDNGCCCCCCSKYMVNITVQIVALATNPIDPAKDFCWFHGRGLVRPNRRPIASAVREGKCMYQRERECIRMGIVILEKV